MAPVIVKFDNAEMADRMIREMPILFLFMVWLGFVCLKIFCLVRFL